MLNEYVSVIIPAYNAERHLAETIDSVISQTYPYVECIIIDDGSTDETAAVAQRYGNRVILVRQENRKLPEARNAGMRLAKGDYVTFLDADDLITPTKIEHQVAYLRKHQGADAVYCKVRYFSDEKPGEFYSLKRPTPEGDILPALVYGNFIPVHSTLIRKRMIDALCVPFRNFPALEDWDFLLRLSLSGCRFGFLDEELADYRMHAGGMSRNETLMFEAKLKVIETIAEESREALLKRELSPDSVVSYHRADLGKALIINGRKDQGIAEISEASLHSFRRKSSYVLFSLAARVVGTGLLRCIHHLTNSCRKRQ
ncbi:glycosyltransferase [Geobacter sp. SVR]|uniref:glycosyltransferase family 2 protein n=1 Tax=Geobacter sp. SVR TaxID=2495594 RepID=UPI00143EF9A6|nr:glycosyltransferase [Geobacter sp. SVR]BCS54873.1 hypothetical protein GSVR_31810 [Geobacter sp. SVR]GCF87391.1 hypothetical protein GSbR_39910 [Geobacter sp. SVR]